MNDFATGVVLVIVAVLILLGGFSLGRTSIVDDCDKLGKFYRSERVFDCREAKP